MAALFCLEVLKHSADLVNPHLVLSVLKKKFSNRLNRQFSVNNARLDRSHPLCGYCMQRTTSSVHARIQNTRESNQSYQYDQVKTGN